MAESKTFIRRAGHAAVVATALVVFAVSGTGCVTNAHYMTENIDLADVTQPGADQAAVSMWVATRGCIDGDTCSGGVRLSTGYVWFFAMEVDVATSADSNDVWGLHGGLAFGGSGQQSSLYADWSGYCPASQGGLALRAGGSPCKTPNSNPTFKPHTVTGLSEQQWYRVTIRKVSCTTSEATDVAGTLTGWQMTVTAQATGLVSDAGTWCIPNASMIAHISLFSELNEPDPCTTDLWGVHMSDPEVHLPSGWLASATAHGHYNGGGTSGDANCANTNLRTAGTHYFIDERGTVRGSNGGLASDGWLWQQ